MHDTLTDEQLDALIGLNDATRNPITANALRELRATRARLAAVQRVLAEHECDEACELFNCDETDVYLVSKDRVRVALGVDDD